MQIEALVQLYSERSTRSYDDRARTVEIQISEDIGIDEESILGVVMPDRFRNEPDITSYGDL